MTEALYSVGPHVSQMADIALQLRIDRFAERVNIQIDKQAYKQWLAETRGQQPRLFSDQNLAQEVVGKVGSALNSHALTLTSQSSRSRTNR